MVALSPPFLPPPRDLVRALRPMPVHVDDAGHLAQLGSNERYGFLRQTRNVDLHVQRAGRRQLCHDSAWHDVEVLKRSRTRARAPGSASAATRRRYSGQSEEDMNPIPCTSGNTLAHDHDPTLGESRVGNERGAAYVWVHFEAAV